MAISRDINNLVINKVENQQVYDYMVQNNLINDDELYLIQGENEGIIQSDLSQTDSTAPDYVKGVIRQESLPEGYPYKTGMTIEWDGNTDGRYSLMGTYYHVSDEILSNNVLKNSTYITNHGTIVRCDLNWDVMESNGLINDDFAIVGEQDIIVVRKAGMTFGNDVCEKTGTYFLRTDLGVSPGLVYIANLSTEETIHTIAPEYLPESVTAQPDWNQNNNTAPDYVKNRPFYIGEPIETVILEEQTFMTQLTQPITDTVSSSNGLIVTFDGTDYECDIWNLGGTLGAGNSSLAGDSTYSSDDPFFIIFQGTNMMVGTNDANAHTVSVTKIAQNLVKIPSEFIPEINFDKGVSTGGTGAAYTVTVDGIKSLIAGLSFIMIPHTASTSQTATLNVNGLGAKQLRRPVSSNNTSTVAPTTANWLYASKPVRVMYNGTYWLVMDMPRPNAPDIYGTVAIENGGTGASTAEAALTNLGAMPAVPVTTSDNGKFLRVVNGAWAATTVPNAEEVSF